MNISSKISAQHVKYAEGFKKSESADAPSVSTVSGSALISGAAAIPLESLELQGLSALPPSSKPSQPSELSGERAEMKENIERAKAKETEVFQQSVQGVRVQGTVPGNNPGYLIMLGDSLEEHMATASNQMAQQTPAPARPDAPPIFSKASPKLDRFAHIAITSGAVGISALAGLVGGMGTMVGGFLSATFAGGMVGALAMKNLGPSRPKEILQAAPDRSNPRENSEVADEIRQAKRQGGQLWNQAVAGVEPSQGQTREDQLALLSNQVTLGAQRRKAES